MPDEMDDIDDSDYLYLVHKKAKRSRRRELEASREPGHLRKWFAAQDNPSISDEQGNDVFRQLLRSHRHSCHAACCAIERYVKRYDRRKDRHEAKRDMKNQRHST
jgi:hypothetical protein